MGGGEEGGEGEEGREREMPAEIPKPYQKHAIGTRTSRPMSHANGPELLGKTEGPSSCHLYFHSFAPCYHPREHCDQTTTNQATTKRPPRKHQETGMIQKHWSHTVEWLCSKHWRVFDSFFYIVVFAMNPGPETQVLNFQE